MSRMDRDFVVSQFTRYVQGFDQKEEGVRLKYAHSLRVSGLCEQIALSLDLFQDDVDLAWLIGVLHDIGRFEQLREYHTFVDYRPWTMPNTGPITCLLTVISAIFWTI